MTKRIISIVTAILLMLQIMLVCPIELSAETPPQTTTYTGTGYTVEYTVKSSWDKTQSIGIKLNNTSDSPMSVWALKYDAHGEIRELYNGEVYKNEGTEYIIRSTSSNSSIEAGKSVEFGYSVTGENLSVPESIVLCSEQREANEAEYSVEFQLSEQWNPTYTAKIVLNNLSQFEMSGWSLSYDSNATVENIWNGKLLNQTDGRITVSGSAENFTLPTGGTTEININGKVSDEALAAANFKLTYTYINEDIEDDNKGEEKEDLVIFAFGNYDEETDNLEVSWYSNTEKGTYEVLKSTDNITYTAITSVTDTDSCSVAGTNLNNGTQYFKVKVTDENGRTAESISFEVTKNETGVTSGYIDTDNDGLADYLEETLGTDPNKADTDNDELTDYEEIYITGTDLLKADTDGNGTADGSEDPDTDGMNNIREIGLETDPLNPDTDGDGLTDGAEVNTHGTDPLKYDTDDDGIGDGDEIKIGLNPKNPATNGVPDNEYTIPQEVTADSEAMSEINTEDNPYELSVEVKAAGNAENISVSESGYANAMHNDAILGIIPELIYDSNCKIDEVVVKFKLEEEVLTEKTELPELKGIQRYQIFKFFEDDNMLLPIITEYNEATNTISATTDCLGTYCVMDMGNFLSSIAALENEETEEPTEPTPMLMSLNAEAPKLTVKPQDEFNVVFAVDTRFAGTPTWETILESISGSAEEIFSRSPKATVYLLEQNMPSATGDSVEEVGTYTNYDELTTAFEEYKNKESVINPLNQCDMSEAIDYVNKNIGGAMPTFMFSFLESQGAKYNKQKRDEVIDGIKPTTDICLVLNNVTPSDTSFGNAAIKKRTENIFEDYQCISAIINHLYSKEAMTYHIISATNYEPITLDQPITRAAKEAPEKLRSMIVNENHTDPTFQETSLEIWKRRLTPVMIEKINEKFGKDFTDKDDDGLYDFEEINFENNLIKFDSVTGKAILPSFADCLKYKYETGNAFYVDSGLEVYKENLREDNSDKEEWFLDYLLYKTTVLPIYSNLDSIDGDADGILDIDEKWNGIDERYKNINPLKKDTIETLYPELKFGKGNNRKENPYYLEIKDNNINIVYNLKFDSLENKAADLQYNDSNKTYKQLVVEAIEENWEGEYKGNKYDFYMGIEVAVTTRFEYNGIGRKISIIIDEDSIEKNRSKVFYTENDSNIQCNFGLDKNMNVVLYSHVLDKPIVNGVFGFKKTVAHEFGHIMGISDGYYDNGVAAYKYGVEVPENYKNALDDIELWGQFDLMVDDLDGIVSVNNIEMILQASIENRSQGYVNYDYLIRSKAIKSPYIVYFRYKIDDDNPEEYCYLDVKADAWYGIGEYDKFWRWIPPFDLKNK